MDFTDDVEPSAPAARFQPKAKVKAKPRAPPFKKVTSAANPSVSQQAADNLLIASPAKATVPNNDISDNADTSNGGVKSAVSDEQTANVQTLSSADPLLSFMENLSTVNPGHMDENANRTGESMIESAEVFAGLDSVDDLMPQPTVVTDATFDSNSHFGADMTSFPKKQEKLRCKGIVDFSNVGDIHMERGQQETKGGQAITLLESYDLTFTPKDTIVVPFESQNTNEGSVEGGLTDFPPMRVDDDSTNPHNECLVNQVGSFEASPDFIPDLPCSTDATTDCYQNQMSELSPALVHEFPSQQNVPLSEHMSAQTVSAVEDNNVHGEEGAGSKKRKASRKSKDGANGSDKPVRKRKKKTDASEASTEQPPKKFPHTTRRRNRCLDKSLLEIPEDEIDYQRLSIKNLILLGEHRERQKREVDTKQTVTPAEENTASKAEPPVVEPVNRPNYSQWDPYDEENEYEDMYNNAEAEDDPSTSAIERDTVYFNYHSHMNKTPRVKWTKQDTELFYQGVHQFGSDLSMILHLFPGRTRQQLKLKYKKEERQQPMKLLDALTNRPKDLSHYKLVIEKLQEQIDREEEQQTAEEEATLGTAGNECHPEEGISQKEGDPEEGTADDTQEQAKDEAAKSKHEQNGDGSGAAHDTNEAKVESPTASNESELDMCDWSAYKSAL